MTVQKALELLPELRGAAPNEVVAILLFSILDNLTQHDVLGQIAKEEGSTWSERAIGIRP